MSVLRVEGIGKRFGGLEVLRDVSLEAEQGRITAIIGPNGAGKSTLANVISGLIRADAGKVVLDERDITRSPAHTRARLGLGRTFQNLQLFAGMTVRENVTLGGFRSGLRSSRGNGGGGVDDAIDALGLRDIQHRPVDELGFGQAKLVEPARLLAMNPSVLVMDEPAAGLGGSAVTTLGAWVKERAAAGIAVLFIEHNMRLVMDVADYIYVLDHGVLIAEGLPAEIRSNPLVLEAYLGHEQEEQ